MTRALSKSVVTEPTNLDGDRPCGYGGPAAFVSCSKLATTWPTKDSIRQLIRAATTADNPVTSGKTTLSR